MVLAVVGFLVDAAFFFPVLERAWEAEIIPPIDRAWGFHAEVRTVGPAHRHLVIATVAPGGAFDEAGIKAGWAMMESGCSLCGPGGGLYGRLATAGDRTTVLYFWRDPATHRERTKVVVKRGHAS